jgi:hypothetical protein
MRTRLTSFAALLCSIAFIADVAFAQNFSGTFSVANQQGGVITLTLQQDGQNALAGTMSGNGVQYQVEGVVEEGIAVGAIYNQEGGVFFEAQIQGSQLLLSLFDVGPDNEPDYSNPTELILMRQGAAAGPTPQPQAAAPPAAAPPTAGNPLSGAIGYAGSFVGEGIAVRLQTGRGGYTGALVYQGQEYPVQATATGGRLQGTFSVGGQAYAFEATLQGDDLALVSDGNTYRLRREAGAAGPANPLSRPEAMPAPAAPRTGAPTATAPGVGEVSDASWGFTFTPPAGWKHQKSYEGAMLGHDQIAGLILVIPHQASSLQEVVGEMQKGMSEEGMYLAPAGQISQRGNSILTGEYTGNVQGEQTRARGFGTLSPYGGGAYVIAVTTPQMYGSDLQGAAEAIVSSLRYVPVDVTALAENFVGTWVYISSGGSTLKNLIFSPNGSFEWIGETSFVYQTPTDVTEGYGKHPESRGRWTVRGSKDQGVITLMLPNGEERYVEYRAESPGRHNRYYFDGTVYFRK